MNLAIDIGNSRTKTGLFSEGFLKATSTHEGLPSIDDLVALVGQQGVKRVGVASVGTQPDDVLAALKEVVDVLIIEPTTSVPTRSKYQSPQTLGIDRLCGVVAAHKRFADDDVLIIDAGTCITYDLVDRDGIHQGGAISPGIKMRLDAMHRFTARLPQVQTSQSFPSIGLDTVGSMRFGSQQGAVAEVQGMIAHFSQSYPHLKVILTGGDRSTFEQHIENAIFAAPNLVLEGIDAILRHNE